MLRTVLIAFLLGSVGAAESPVPATTVPFYIFIGQSNSGWLGTGALSAEQKSAYVGRIPETEIWNPANGGHGARWEPLEVGANTRCENFADPTGFGAEASLFADLQKR